MALKKPVLNGSSGSSTRVADWSGTILKDFPTLCEFLASGVYEDGSKRLTGTFQLFTEGGIWKATLRDKELKCFAFLSSETIEGLLLSVEVALQEGKVEWRPDKPFPKR